MRYFWKKVTEERSPGVHQHILWSFKNTLLKEI